MLRGAALQLGDQVRFRYGLAELLGAGRRAERRDRGRPQSLHAPHGGALRRVRGASGPRLRRWARTDRQALLHKLRRAPLRPRQETRVTPGTGAQHPAGSEDDCVSSSILSLLTLTNNPSERFLPRTEVQEFN